MTNFDKNDVNANQAKNEEENEEKKMAKETNDQREESKMNEEKDIKERANQENKFPKLTKEEVKQMLQLPDIANDDGLYVPSDGDEVAKIYKTTNYDQFI